MVADILTRRDQGYQNQILHGPALTWPATQLSGDITESLTLETEEGRKTNRVKIIDQYRPDLTGFVRLWWVRGLIMKFSLARAHPEDCWHYEWSAGRIIPLAHYWLTWYERGRMVTDGTNGQSVPASIIPACYYYSSLPYPTIPYYTLLYPSIPSVYVSLFFNNP